MPLMSTQEKEVPPLDQDSTARLTDFARACKAAARAVTLYPSSHPAIRLSLARLVDAASRITAKGSVVLGVVPDNLLMDGAASPQARSGRPRNRRTAARPHDWPHHAALEPRSRWVAAVPAPPREAVRRGARGGRHRAAVGGDRPAPSRHAGDRLRRHSPRASRAARRRTGTTSSARA